MVFVIELYTRISLDHLLEYIYEQVLFVYVLTAVPPRLSFWSFVCFVASDVLTTICHLAIVNVRMIIILYIGNTQISILLLCFLYLFVELMITMNEYNFV